MRRAASRTCHEEFLFISSHYSVLEVSLGFLNGGVSNLDFS